MRSLFIFVLSFSFVQVIQAQTLDEINLQRYRHSKNGSIALTSWAGANIISGAIGFATTPSGEWKHFHEMNIYWNIVNLGIGIPGLFGKKDKEMGLSLQETIKRQNTYQMVYLANGVLDIAYITGGFLMREVGNSNSHDQEFRDRWVGFGNSLIMQGAFLMIFDFVQFGLHTINGKRIYNNWDKLSFRPYGVYGLGLSMQYDLSGETLARRDQPVQWF